MNALQTPPAAATPEAADAQVFLPPDGAPLPAPPPQQQIPAGWYPNPSAPGQRYWDGTSWTPTAYAEPYAQPVTSAKSSKATWALVMGILGILLIPIVFSILAIVFGVSARSEIDRNPQISGRGNATAGVVLGIIGLAGWALIFAATV